MPAVPQVQCYSQQVAELGFWNVHNGVKVLVPLGRVAHGCDKVAVQRVAPMSCGGGCLVMEFLKAGSVRGQRDADVGQDAALGAERLGGVVEGALGA